MIICCQTYYDILSMWMKYVPVVVKVYSHPADINHKVVYRSIYENKYFVLHFLIIAAP